MYAAKSSGVFAGSNVSVKVEAPSSASRAASSGRATRVAIGGEIGALMRLNVRAASAARERPETERAIEPAHERHEPRVVARQQIWQSRAEQLLVVERAADGERLMPQQVRRRMVLAVAARHPREHRRF